MTDDDEIIAQRIAGKSVRAIAEAQHCNVAAVNEAIDRWAALYTSSGFDPFRCIGSARRTLPIYGPAM